MWLASMGYAQVYNINWAQIVGNGVSLLPEYLPSFPERKRLWLDTLDSPHEDDYRRPRPYLSTVVPCIIILHL
jgi:hypothetical protein